MKNLLLIPILFMSVISHAQSISLVNEFVPGDGSCGPINNYISFNNSTYLFRLTATQSELWKTDGSTAGTVSIQSFDASIVRPNFTVLNNDLYFVATTSNKHHLWKYDGSNFTLLTPAQSSVMDDEYELTVFNNRLFFFSEPNLLQVTIADNMGKRMFSTSKNQVDISHLSTGIYFADIRLKNGERWYAKFTKL